MKRLILIVLACTALCIFPQHTSAAALTPKDREYLIRALSSCYPDVGFGGRVGICAVVLNRMADDRFPDTAASVIAHFGDGCFSTGGDPDEKVLRLTADALDMVLSGADPTGGALYFAVLDDGSPVYDMKFDNSGEKKRLRDVKEGSGGCTAVMDGIGFYP